MKIFNIIVFAIVALAMSFTGGCSCKDLTSDKSAKKLPYIHSHKTTWGVYGRAEVTGVIYNPTQVAVMVCGAVVFYQNNIQVGSERFYCTSGAHEKATFEVASYTVGSGDYKYDIQIMNVYNL